MKPQDYNNLAGQLIEYGMELSKREHQATAKADFETLEKINKIKTNIQELLEALDEEY